ncbi:MAG: oligosaccharide flippase family protein [Candidatus Cloacimonetes bacterium]|nr:oligosaccharide flippase family protein [Candidatus Cloacimonadota bacterium]
MKEYVEKILHYTAGNLLQKIILLALLPVFTHFLAPQEYAIYTNIVVFISFASLLYFLGFQQAIFSYFYHKKTPEYHYTLISSIFISILVFGVILSLLIVIFRAELSQLILRSPDYAHIMIWVSVILLFDVIYGMVLSILNMMERSKQYILVGNFKHLLLLILLVVAAIASRFSLDTIFILMMISSALAVLVAIGVMGSIMKDFANQITEKRIFSFPIVKKLFSFGLIMIPGTFAMLILKVSDRYMITYLSVHSLYDVGIYAIGYRIGMIVTFLNSIVSLVYFPYAMRIADYSHAKESFKKVFNAYVIFGGIVGFFVILFSPEIFKIFINKSYHEAIKIVFFGVISNYLYGIFNIINLSFYVKRRAGNIALAVGLGAILNIVLNFILIPKYGIYGAGIASILAFGLIVIFSFIIAETIYPISYKIRYIVFSLIILISTSSINFVLDYQFYHTFIKVLFLIIIAIIAVKYAKQKKIFNEIYQKIK